MVVDFGVFFFFRFLFFTINLMLVLLQIALQIAEKLLQVAVKLRLEFCLIYAAVIAIFFEPWAEAHTMLALGVLIAIAAATLLSWIITFVWKIQAWQMRVRADRVNRDFERLARENNAV